MQFRTAIFDEMLTGLFFTVTPIYRCYFPVLIKYRDIKYREILCA